MSKITSEDCAKWIVKNVCPNTKPGDWKRVSKRKVGGDVVRMFSNPNYPIGMVGVSESDVAKGTVTTAGKGPATAARTFRGRLTKDELAGAVAHAFASMDQGVFNELEHLPSECGNDPIEFMKKNRMYGIMGLTRDVQKDLEAVNFCDENSEWEPGEGFCGGTTGFQTLPNGLTFLGVTAGGDWEEPLFYAIYWDGDKLRAYIPTDGNHWNTDTNTAYGSEGEVVADEDKAEKASYANLKKRFGAKDAQSLGDFDMAAILADIERNVVSADGPSAKPKGMADIDLVKAKADKDAADRRSAKPYVPSPATMGGVQVIVQGGSLLSEAMRSGTFAERLDDVKAEAQAFLKELDELRGMNLDAAAVAKARGIYGGALQRVVGKYTSVVALMQRAGI